MTQNDGMSQLQFADRLNNVETSAIRELFKLLGKPGIISFAGGFPDSAMFDVEGLREASQRALAEEAGGALQYGATEGYEPLRAQLAAFERIAGQARQFGEAERQRFGKALEPAAGGDDGGDLA